MSVQPPQSARDKFMEVLRSRGMLKPGEEWVIDANLEAFANELAEKQRAWARKNQDALAGNAWDQVHAVINLIEPQPQQP